jgi:hypothetical protein
MRREDWEVALAAFVERHQDVPFEWGLHDCCTFACGAVNAVTGVKPILPYKYETEDEARMYLAKVGGFVGLWCSLLGEVQRPKLAAAGDVVLFDYEGVSATGVCIGDKIAALTEFALVRVPMSRARMCWKVD